MSWTTLVVSLALAALVFPFLRWSFVRRLIGMPKRLEDWEAEDRREQRVLDYVLERARPGSVDAAVRVIDDFGLHKSLLISVGDTQGPLLDQAVRSARPKLVLELGTYIGYSALRISRLLAKGGRVCSVELDPSNAKLARRIVAHAGASDRISIVVGTLGDGGATLDRLAREHGFARGAVDLVFLDHDKEAYLSDLQLVLRRGWLHRGSVVVADNAIFPGAPKYRAYMQAQEGKLWRTVEHSAPTEYQSLIQDLVQVSEYLAASPGS